MKRKWHFRLYGIDSFYPRMRWKLGLIVNTYEGSDGIVRSAKLKTSYGVTNRPVSKLYPLEVRSEAIAPNIENVIQYAERPKRLAALKARNLIRNMDV